MFQNGLAKDAVPLGWVGGWSDIPDWASNGGGRGGAGGPRLWGDGEAMGAPGLGAPHRRHLRPRHVGKLWKWTIIPYMRSAGRQ